MTGTPAAIASTTLKPNGSAGVVARNIEARLMSEVMSLCIPNKVTEESSPS